MGPRRSVIIERLEKRRALSRMGDGIAGGAFDTTE